MVIPFINCNVPAGFPSPANDYLEETIDLNKEFIPHPLATFIITTEGDSMTNAFIPNKAMLLVDKSLKAKTGDIVVAVVNGEFTVKYLEIKEFSCRLLPANEKYPPLKITEEIDMQIWGVVTKIIIDPKDVKHVRPC
jgi:DNA polymerase V